MRILTYRSFLFLVLSCWLFFLLTACGPATTTGAGNPNPTTAVTKTPTPTSPPAKMVLTFECKGEFNPGGAHEKICVRTLPGASLTIKVTYCVGSVDQSDALKGIFTADKTGYYEWSWTPRAACQGNPPGATGFWKGTADVKATLGGQSLTSSVFFVV